MLFNISILSASIFHREDPRLQNDDGAPPSAQRPFPSSWVNLGRNNCILVRDRWCHFAVRNLVFHNFAIWRATCIETLQDRGDDCYMAEKGEDNPRSIRGNRKLGFPNTSHRPCDPVSEMSLTWTCPFDTTGEGERGSRCTYELYVKYADRNRVPWRFPFYVSLVLL